MKYFDEREKELISSIKGSIESGKIHLLSNDPQMKDKLINAAKVTNKKTEVVNLRLTKSDLLSLKLKADEEGLPYQTFISSILHKYVSGALALYR